MTVETLAQAAYRSIKQDILEGRITPEAALSERGLADRQGISRTPLRSALSRLEREGVVSRLANGVILIRPVSVDQVLDIVELRRVLESAAARRAATFGMTPELAELRGVMTAYAGGRNVAFDTFWTEDERFHVAVARAARLDILPGILAEQRAIARRATITRIHDRFADQGREHVEVIDAIAAGDADAAEAAMMRHFDSVAARFLGWLSRTDRPLAAAPPFAFVPEDPACGFEAVFPAAEFAGRIARLQASLRPTGADAALLTGPENIFWATGWQTAGYFAFQALVVPASGEPTLLVRQLEITGARAATCLADIRAWQDGEDPARALAAVVADLRIGALAIERTGWFVSPDLADRIAAAMPGVRLLDGSGLAKNLRVVKSPAELAAIRHAAAYAQAGLAAGIEASRAGTDENAVAAAIMAAAIAAGSEAMAMGPFVSSGPRSGIPHATWRRRVIEPGDCVFLELAASHHRYHAGLMRSVWIGEPPAEARRMMDVALRALDAALAAMRPGVPCAAPHEAAQAVVDAAGYTDALRKRIGYSIGAAFAPDWGEGAILSLFTGVTRPLEPGMVFHLPATLRRYGAFTVGASETVIVTETGVEPLSDLPRTLTVR